MEYSRIRIHFILFNKNHLFSFLILPTLKYQKIDVFPFRSKSDIFRFFQNWGVVFFLRFRFRLIRIGTNRLLSKKNADKKKLTGSVNQIGEIGMYYKISGTKSLRNEKEQNSYSSYYFLKIIIQFFISVFAKDGFRDVIVTKN
ncbi:hypothetical protein DLM78_11470 [Leptospira stimsonii]|uniref:Uncharacterized protein n=1 Tax=Leptospira stimsonii TaxID=2202203 RepID=A0A8B6RYL9_9LEPT|nr:hypothetical protein DLM78_11470 [Leptospira stimsonii]